MDLFFHPADARKIPSSVYGNRDKHTQWRIGTCLMGPPEIESAMACLLHDNEPASVFDVWLNPCNAPLPVFGASTVGWFGNLFMKIVFSPRLGSCVSWGWR